MFGRVLVVPVLLGFLFCLPTSAQGAATLTGSVRDGNKVALSGVEVRLWLKYKTKRWAILKKATTNSGGTYSFTNLSAGTYKLDARIPKGKPTIKSQTKDQPKWADRWYDKAAPDGKGYVGDHADEFAIKDKDALKGYDIVLEKAGGLTTKVGSLGGVLARVQNTTEPRTHHNDVSQGSSHSGTIYFRGLKPGTYRVFYHRSDGAYKLGVDPGPYGVTSSKITSGKSYSFTKAATDPYEPNNKPNDTGALINGNLFQQQPPLSYTTSGARIGKRNTGDVDWTCFDAVKGDRYIVEAYSQIKVGSKVLEHPWMDPQVAFYHMPSKTGTPVKVKEDDDSGATTYGAKVDSGVLKSSGRYCTAVTTYGDTKYVGTSQGSAGHYTLNIKVGNRLPKLAVTHKGKSYAGALTPATANYLKVTEGEKLSFAMVFSDPDKDTLTASVSLADAGGKSVGGTSFKDASGKVLKQAGDTFAGGIGSASFNWEVGQTAAKASPYELKLRVKDAEFTQEVRYVITLKAVNNAPTAPVPNAPTHKAIVATNAPSLEVLNSTDIDGDTLTYEFELYQGTSTGKPIQVKTVTEGKGGKTTLALTGLKENSWFFFRARANDGNATAGYSPWSSFSAFFVDSKNDPPTAPLLVKPADKSTLYSQNPTLSAVNPTDPDEFGNLTIFFQLAEDVGFTTGLFTSPGGVPMNQKGLSTGYKLPMWLKLAKTYYVRAYALDSKGLKGPYSNINEFKLYAKPDIGVPDASVTPDGNGALDVGSGGEGGLLDNGQSGADKGGTPTDPGGDDTGCDCKMSDRGDDLTGLVWLLAVGVFLCRRRKR